MLRALAIGIGLLLVGCADETEPIALDANSIDANKDGATWDAVADASPPSRDTSSPIDAPRPVDGIVETRGTVTIVAPSPLSAAAAQDGEGPWQALEHRDGAYRFEVQSGRYRLVFVCVSSRSGEIMQATLDEVTSIRTQCPARGGDIKLSGAIRGLPETATVRLAVGRRGARYAPATTFRDSYEVMVTAGQYDLLAQAEIAGGPSRILIQRDVAVAAPTNIDLDFGASLITGQVPLAVAGDEWPPELLEAHVVLTSELGARLIYPVTQGRAWLVSSTLLVGHSQAVSASIRGSSDGVLRGAQLPYDGTLAAFRPPRELYLRAERLMDNGSGARIRVTFEPLPGDGLTYYKLYVPPSQGTGIHWRANVGAGWLAGQTRIETPDVSLLPGFDPQWAPRRDVLVVHADAYESSRRMQVEIDGQEPLRSGDWSTHSLRSAKIEPAVLP